MVNSGPSYWQRNPNAEKILRKLWAEGKSATYILNELGAARELSRNAVIGKAHRLGLDRHRYGNNTGQCRTREHIIKPKRERIIVDTEMKHTRVSVQQVNVMRSKQPQPTGFITDIPGEESNTAVTLFDAQPHHCRWPVSDAPFLFCGKTVQRGASLSYCPHHMQRALSKQQVSAKPYFPAYKAR